MFKLALDAGHGINTPGRRVPAQLDPAQTREWQLNDRVGDYIEQELAGYDGIEILRLDDSDDGSEDVAMARRVEAANDFGADVCLSFHHNAAGKTFSGGGITAYAHPKARAESFAWRDEIYEALIEQTGLAGNRTNPKATGNFQILRETKMAAALFELGFMDSTQDAPKILTEEYARACARAAAAVVVRRAGLVKKPAPQSPAAIRPGDLVSIRPGAVYYSGKAVPMWVAGQRWYVLSVSGDRAVIHANEAGTSAICSPIRVDQLIPAGSPSPAEPAREAVYSEKDGVRMVAVPTERLRIVLMDDRKKCMGENACNGGFFGNYNEGPDKFTLPAGHLVCELEAQSEWVNFYCNTRGKVEGKRFCLDTGSPAWGHANPLHGKALSTLIITDGKARVEDRVHAPALSDCRWAITGVPIMRGGEDVKFATYVKGQGWGGSSLYATWHTFVGLKDREDTVYLMAMKTTTKNMILSAEAFRKFKALGFREVLKMDGGGSFYFNAGGKVKATLENRRICTVFRFD